MVDENLSSTERSQRQNLLSASSCVDTDMDDLDVNGKMENLNRSSCDTSTSSPESTSENGFSFNESKFISAEEKSSEKKVHWNPSQVMSLLNCIEKRISDFRKKSVQKSVWLSIGKEMLEHGDFSVEHCYNKWKNLRRDVRLFNNTNNMQKLSIRNAYIMEKVRKMVIDIGYENSSRKSSSPISPSMDTVDPSDMTGAFRSSVTQNDSWISCPQIKAEPCIIPTEIIVVDQNINEPCQNQVNSNSNVSLEDSLISLLSDPSVSQTILMNPKLLEEIIPGLDISTLLKKFVDAHPEIMSMPGTNAQSNPHHASTNVDTRMQEKKVQISENNGRQQYSHNGQSLPTAIDVGNSWPHQLYELLHSFRDEESRQMQRLDQILGYVQVMQDSTKRRLSTINQLIALAGMLIPQR